MRPIFTLLLLCVLPVSATTYVRAEPERLTRKEKAKPEYWLPRIVKGCERGNLLSCVKAGRAAEDGSHQQFLPQQAEYYYGKACAGGYQDGCSFLVGRKLWLNTISGKPYTESDMEWAELGKELRRYCDQGNGVGCFYLAGFTTGSPDERKTMRYNFYVRSCDLGEPMGCHQAAVEMPASEGVDDPKQIDEWIRLLHRGCRLGKLSDCEWLGNTYRLAAFKRRDLVLARRYLKHACKKEWFGACSSFGEMYRDGEGVDKDFARALALFEKSCPHGESYGCYEAGVMYRDGLGTPVNRVKADDFFKRCEDWDSRCRDAH